MLFSRPLSAKALAELSRVLRHYLSAGMTVMEVFQQQALRGHSQVRPLAQKILDELKKGESLEDALKKEAHSFPRLFVSLVCVGEETGMLPDVCGELEKYYILQQSLWHQFVGQITWPILQFFAAIFIISGLIYVLGIINQSNPGSQGFDPIGLGIGPGPALAFLIFSLSLFFSVPLIYLVGRRLGRADIVDALALGIPALGPCLQSLALTRLCLALQLTLETGMSTVRALRLSLEATGNTVFSRAFPAAGAAVKAGEELAVALARVPAVPREFLEIITVGEESGRLPEILAHQGKQYQEESERRLRYLATATGGVVWLVVTAIIVIAIFRMALSYLTVIDPNRYGL